jgi:hypothetical protein
MVSRPYSKQRIVAKTFAKSWTWINQPELASRVKTENDGINRLL